MTDESKPEVVGAIELDEATGKALLKTVREYGTEGFGFAWKFVFEPLMPLANGLFRAQEIFELASEYQLQPNEIVDAITLLAMLKCGEDPHCAWRAAEILLRYAKSREHLVAAMGPAQGRA